MELRIKSMLSTLMLLLSLSASAQNWEETFRQRRTQRKYLLQQLAALKVYAGYLEKGYEIAASGLKTIREISGGEWDLHRVFLTSLGAVNPMLRADAQMAGAFSLRLGIGRLLRRDLFEAEDEYLNRLRSGLLDRADRDLEELLALAIPGELEMNDAERIRRMEALQKVMLEHYRMAAKLRDRLRIRAAQRQRELEDLSGIKKLTD